MSKMFAGLLRLNGILLALGSAVVAAEMFRECDEADKAGTFVASKSDCAKYIFCDGENSFAGECLDDNYFNEQAGNCDDRAAVVCPIGGGQIGGGPDAGRIPEASAHADSNNNIGGGSDSLIFGNSNHYGGFISHANTNNNNGVISNSNNNNSNSHHTNSNVMPHQWAMQHNLDVIGAGPGVGNSLPRPFTDPLAEAGNHAPQCPMHFGPTNLIFLPSTESCSAYYTCYNGIAIPMACARHSYFDPQSGKCERQERVSCALERPVSLTCHKGIYDFIPHPRNCEYYYFCSNGYLMIFQCPFQFTWHYERRTCVHRSQAKCFSSVVTQMTHLTDGRASSW